MENSYHAKGAKLRLKVLNKLLNKTDSTDPFVNKDQKPNPYVEMILQDVLNSLRQAETRQIQGNLPGDDKKSLNVKLISLPGVSIEDI